MWYRLDIPLEDTHDTLCARFTLGGNPGSSCAMTTVTSIPLLPPYQLPPYLCYLRTSVTSVLLLHLYLRTTITSVPQLPQYLCYFCTPSSHPLCRTPIVQLLTLVSCCKLTGKPSSSLLHEPVYVWSCNVVSSHQRAFFSRLYFSTQWNGDLVHCLTTKFNARALHLITSGKVTHSW